MGAILSLLPQSTNKQHRGLTGLAYVATIVPLHYKSIKYIKVDVPIVAIIHRFCQLLAVLLSFTQLYFNDGWAMAEVPGGMANAWGEIGTMLATTNDTTLSSRTPYCSNASFTYVEGDYAMVAPQCRVMEPVDIIVKTVDSIFFTTAFLETATKGWPCGTGGTNEHACLASNGTLFTRDNGQCGCQTSRAIYPLGVDQLAMSLEHAYDTSSEFGDWQGSSAEGTGGSVRQPAHTSSDTSARVAPSFVAHVALRRFPLPPHSLCMHSRAWFAATWLW